MKTSQDIVELHLKAYDQALARAELALAQKEISERAIVFML